MKHGRWQHSKRQEDERLQAQWARRARKGRRRIGRCRTGHTHAGRVTDSVQDGTEMVVQDGTAATVRHWGHGRLQANGTAGEIEFRDGMVHARRLSRTKPWPGHGDEFDEREARMAKMIGNPELLMGTCERRCAARAKRARRKASLKSKRCHCRGVRRSASIVHLAVYTASGERRMTTMVLRRKFTRKVHEVMRHSTPYRPIERWATTPSGRASTTTEGAQCRPGVLADKIAHFCFPHHIMAKGSPMRPGC